MPPTRTHHPNSLEHARATLVERLRPRQAELELAILERFYMFADTSREQGPDYTHGLRTAVSAGIAFGLSTVELGERRAPAIPIALFAQARQAARHGVGLDTAVHRCFVAHTLLCDFIMQEAAENEELLGIGDVTVLVRDQVALLNRLIPALTEEYAREAAELLASPAERRAGRIRRLLAGELLDTSDLSYDFDAWHIALLVVGTDAPVLVGDLASRLGLGALCVPGGQMTAWAWVGARARPDSAEVAGLASAICSPQTFLAIGEPSHGLAGWRLSHRQALAALPIGQRRHTNVIRYVDHALVASLSQDDLLSISLREFYLRPLSDQRDGGQQLRDTLRAYFSARRQVASTAAALQVSRKTVSNRLATAERCLGRSLASCAPELETALRLEISEGPT